MRTDNDGSNVQQLENAKQYLPFSIYVFYVFPFFLISNPSLKLIFATLVSLAGFSLTTYLSVKHFKEKEKTNKKKTTSLKEATKPLRFTFFFAIIYLFVARIRHYPINRNIS